MFLIDDQESISDFEKMACIIQYRAISGFSVWSQAELFQYPWEWILKLELFYVFVH